MPTRQSASVVIMSLFSVLFIVGSPSFKFNDQALVFLLYVFSCEWTMKSKTHVSILSREIFDDAQRNQSKVINYRICKAFRDIELDEYRHPV